MKSYRFLLFDIDGTLMDFKKGEACAIKETMRQQGFPFRQGVEELYSQINDGFWKRFERGEIDREQVLYGRFRELFRALGAGQDVEEFAAVYQRLLGEQVYYMEGAVGLIRDLYGDYDLCLVTNGVAATQYSRLARDHFGDYFQHIFISEETGFRKPMKEFFDHCSERIPDFDPERALIIGDSLTSDIRGGNAAGIDTCWFNPDGKQAGPDVEITYEITALDQLREICPPRLLC